MPPSENTRLLDFISAGKTKGASDEFLAALLIRRGWHGDAVYAALGSHWETVTGIAIPARSGSGESAKDAFLYLLSFSTLATWSGALGSMLFQFIDYWIPDAVSPHVVYGLRSTVTWQMASIAVAFPIYLLVMKLIFGEAANAPERLQSGVRKWLTYIALLATAGAVICDLIWFFDYFLTGELTLRFMLKSATVILICGGIFAYYLGSLRWNRSTDLSRERARNLSFGAVAAAAVIAVFGIGLGVAGTPGVQRRIEADRKRVGDLKSLANAVKFWHDQKQGANSANSPAAILSAVPSALAELGTLQGRLRLADPETNARYEYHPQSGGTYELCAVFAAEEMSQEAGDRYTNVYTPHFWYHAKGRACFTLDAAKPVPWQ
ncbi:MAG TPA: DUF5671 domain-containing protein [Candidatus Acidoferrales bacterium]|jgi:hypothetical protein|nr:DUF5671 domain-containing protein [Candidatus Acidoferrales bacterium]